MTTILNFVHKPPRRSAARPAPPPQGALVIIFPGIRYERFDKVPTGRGGGDRPRRTRREVAKR